ncbi:MAG TPA: tetratricopeptide repeat protein [Noviherbaspirillum sp.]
MTAGLLHFARPWWLLALLPLAGLVWHVWRTPHVAASAWKQLVDAHLLPHLLTDAAPGERRLGLSVLAAGLAIAVLALAGPTRDAAERTLQRAALRVIVVALSPDAASHLERIKAKAASLLRALPAGETALIVYADEPYLVVPPTTDVEVVARFIPELAIDAMPVPGNRPDRAVGMASALFQRNAPARTHTLIWLAADAAAPVRALDGRSDVRMWMLHGGSTEEPSLSHAVQRTGGQLVRMQDDDSDVRRLASALSFEESRAAPPEGHRQDVGYLLLPLLLPLAVLAFRRGVLMLAATVLCAGLLAPPSAHALNLADVIAGRLLLAGKADAAAADAAAAGFSDTDWRAVAHYRAGRFEEAARLLEGRNDPDALYNRGNALAKQGRLLEALGSYEASLAQRPADADTLHNRDLVRRLLNQQNRQGGKANQSPQSESARDADRVAEQWLRGVPDEPQSLLRRKLALEHQQRAAGKVEKPW